MNKPTSTTKQQKPSIVWPTAILLTVTPIVAIVGIVWYQATVGFSWTHWLAFLVIALFNGISITAGYHRLWSHNAYKAHTALRLFYALFGAAAYQNSILVWASQHRRHHRHVDHIDNDPYSAQRGLWFSHVGWMLRNYPANDDDFSNANDLQRDPIVVWQHKHYYSIAFLMNLLPPLLLGAITGEYIAYFLTVGFLRLVYSHHTTFFINSLAHYWGSQPYTEENSARDNGLLAFVTYGEGYHNFHHLFQADYRNGVRWWQFDPTKWLIKTCSWLGLTWDLRQTPNFKIREALVKRQLEAAKEKIQDNEAMIKWRSYIEKETQQLTELLDEWRIARAQWLKAKKDKWAEATGEFQRALELKAASSRFKEMEYALQQQYQRLRFFNLQLAAA